MRGLQDLSGCGTRLMYPRDNLARAYDQWSPPAPLAIESHTPITRALVVEDDHDVRELIAAVLTSCGYDVAESPSAEEALILLRSSTFDVLLTDIKMPGMSGLDLLHRVHAASPELPVILITGEADGDLVRRALTAGASDVVTKPCTASELPVIVERNLARAAMARGHRETLSRQLQVSYETVLDALLSALDTRNTETEGHSERVTAYTMLLAHYMGVPKDQAYHIERGALLHDIGKIGVPDRILLKPGPLTDDEWDEMRKHPIVGYRMCVRIDFLADASEIVLHHHERWDGKGYPTGLRGEDIPLGARIFSVVDAFDAMTTDRPYRAAMPYEEAYKEIARGNGTQFDPDVVKAFLAVPNDQWTELREQLER